LAFEQPWVSGLRAGAAEPTAAAKASTEPTDAEPKPSWRANHADWRRRPAWQPLPLWDPGPEPMVREAKPARTASGAFGANKRPMMFGARGRPRPAVGTGMKDLRVQLAAVATEVVAQATDAQEVFIVCDQTRS
jgi:hypothetical protein